jgi:hypothetical protein
MIGTFEKALWLLVWLFCCCSALGLPDAEQLPIACIERMPNLPQPYQMRDWRKVTENYLDLLGNTERRGEYLPLMTWPIKGQPQVRLSSYVGGPGGPEGINFLAAIVSGGLVGKDMRHFRGHDWVAMSTNYFSSDHGVCGNGWGGGSGSTFWYDLFPNVLFFQICALNPGDPARDKMLFQIAERWYEGCLALGASTNGQGVPNFDHLSLNLHSMKPVDNGQWIEPEGAAGVAWCEYMAWTRFKDPRFLTAADWALRALLEHPRQKNPLYEVLLPYGALAAARMNAELGRNYDSAKLLNWCFEPMDSPAARPWWGVLSDRFGDFDCHGLVGSSTDTDGYAFAMNTFQWAGTLAPLARYDTRYARAMGKWFLNLANASRFFYADALPADHQDHRDWADKYDPKYCLAYEGLRKHPRHTTAIQPYATGDAHGSHSNVLNFCLYGSSHVGALGGIISRTSDEQILQIDLLRTDYFHAQAYPTFLFYNPHPVSTQFRADFGPQRCDLYDAGANRVLKQNVVGKTSLELPADTALVIVSVPTGGLQTRQAGRVRINGIVASWNYRK